MDNFDSFIECLSKRVSGHARRIVRGQIDRFLEDFDLSDFRPSTKELLYKNKYGQFLGTASVEDGIGELFVFDNSFIAIKSFKENFINLFIVYNSSGWPESQNFISVVNEEILVARYLPAHPITWENFWQVIEGDYSLFYSDIPEIKKGALRLPSFKFSEANSKLDQLPFQAPSLDDPKSQMVTYFLDKKVRELFQSLSKNKKMLKDDAVAALEASKVNLLISDGLLSISELYKCRQTNKEILLIEDVALNEQVCPENLKCPHCSKKLSQELVAEIVSLSEPSLRLVTSSGWMYVWISNQLINSGVKKKEIKWNVTWNSNDIDIVFKYAGKLCCLELKDREFGQGDAFPFTYRCDYVSADYGIVASSERVAEDAKEILVQNEDQKKNQYKSFEGIEGIQNGIRQLITEIDAYHVRKMFHHFSQFVGIDLWRIMEEYLNRKWED